MVVFDTIALLVTFLATILIVTLFVVWAVRSVKQGAGQEVLELIAIWALVVFVAVCMTRAAEILFVGG